MASTHSTPNLSAEHCDSCETKRRHEVSIDLVAADGDSDHATSSREPYRIAECIHCGTTKQTRMNNA